MQIHKNFSFFSLVLCDKKKNNNIICVDVNDANPILHSISTTQQPEQEKVKEEEEKKLVLVYVLFSRIQ